MQAVSIFKIIRVFEVIARTGPVLLLVINKITAVKKRLITMSKFKMKFLKSFFAKIAKFTSPKIAAGAKVARMYFAIFDLIKNSMK